MLKTKVTTLNNHGWAAIKAFLTTELNKTQDLEEYFYVMEKGKDCCTKWGIHIINEDFVMAAIQQMNDSIEFNKKELIEWEQKPNAAKTLANLKTYFGDIIALKKQ